MATHSSVLAWRIPGTGEPGGLPSMRSHRVGHNWSDLAASAAYCLLEWLYQFTFPPTAQELSLFSTPSPAFIVCRFFHDGHSDQCEVISHCGPDLLFSSTEQCWASFHVFVSHMYVFSGEVCLGLFSTFWLGCLFFWYWVVWASCIFLEIILCQLFHLLLFFSYSECFYFYSSLCYAETFNYVPFVYFCFYFHYSGRQIKKDTAAI